MKKYIKHNNLGITLIALVITISVLLILAGITIAILTGESGLLIKANNAREITQKEEIKERISLSVQATIVDGRGKIEYQNLNKELEKEFGEDSYKIISVGKNYLILVDNKQYKIIESGEVEEGKEIAKSNIEYPGDLSKGGKYDGTTEKTAFRINCIEDLVEWSNNYKTYNTSYINLERTLDFESTESYNDYTAITTDINGNGIEEALITELTTARGFLPISNFSGTFDGNNNEIRNLYENTQETAGMFKTGACNIKKLKLSGIIKTTGNYAAGFIGMPAEEVIIENCVNNCDVESNDFAGGLIGITGNKVSIYNSINLGNILATNYAGGIIGESLRNETNIINTANWGDIGSTSKGKNNAGIIGFYTSYYHGQEKFNVINTYNIGLIEGTDRKAAVIGGNWSSQSVYKIENNFYLEGCGAIKGIYNFIDNSEVKTKEYMQSQEFVDDLNKYIDENEIEGITLLKWKYNEGNYPTFE